MTVFTFDIDLTISDTEGNDYPNSKPRPDIVKIINDLYDEGNIIKIFTGRGSASGKDWRVLTVDQLKEWGVKYHYLIMGKPDTDYFIDDKALSLAILQANDISLINIFVEAFMSGKKILMALYKKKELSFFPADLAECLRVLIDKALQDRIDADRRFMDDKLAEKIQQLKDMEAGWASIYNEENIKVQNLQKQLAAEREKWLVWHEEVLAVSLHNLLQEQREKWAEEKQGLLAEIKALEDAASLRKAGNE
jgi:hypothetical protein